MWRYRGANSVWWQEGTKAIALDAFFGTSTAITQVLTATGVASTSAVGTPSVATGAVTLTATGVESTSAVGTPTVQIAATAITVTASSVVNLTTVGNATTVQDPGLVMRLKQDGIEVARRVVSEDSLAATSSDFTFALTSSELYVLKDVDNYPADLQISWKSDLYLVEVDTFSLQVYPAAPPALTLSSAAVADSPDGFGAPSLILGEGLSAARSAFFAVF